MTTPLRSVPLAIVTFVLVSWLYSDPAVAEKAFFASLQFRGVKMKDQYALGLSDDGATVVGVAGKPLGGAGPEDDEWWPVRWTPHGLERLVETPLQHPTWGALDASGNGSVVIGDLGNGPLLLPEVLHTHESFRWTPWTGLQELGVSPGHDFSGAAAVSPDGVYVVGSSTDIAGEKLEWTAFRWSEAGGFEDIEDLPGGAADARARAASGDGSVVVGRAAPDPCGLVPFRWTPVGGMSSLGSLLPPDADIDDCARKGDARAVSADGRVIVGYTQAEDEDGSIGAVAFRWSEREGLVDLGARRSGFAESFASDVSAAGSVIVGTGARSGARRTHG